MKDKPEDIDEYRTPFDDGADDIDWQELPEEPVEPTEEEVSNPNQLDLFRTS